jgi:hypothetical protein
VPVFLLCFERQTRTSIGQTPTEQTEPSKDFACQSDTKPVVAIRAGFEPQDNINGHIKERIRIVSIVLERDFKHIVLRDGMSILAIFNVQISLCGF